MTKVTQEHIDARTGAIQRAALVAFARKGYERTTMAEIAEEAGLSAGAIYRYFPGKAQLLQSVFDEAVGRNSQVFAEESAAAASPLDALGRIGVRSLDEATIDAECMELEFVLTGVRGNEATRDHHSVLRNAIVGSTAALVRDGQAGGTIRRDLDAGVLALAGVALILGLRMIRLERGEEPGDEAAVHAFVEMLKPCPPAS
ncbi:MAG: TetR/AcrR family transcriptional regulator [Chloroflexi bacterium]|nr:TetR/AcrR family transcriptional regulator [Chloroflexota bacterium]